MIDILCDIPPADRPRAVYVLDLFMDILGLARRHLEADDGGRPGEKDSGGDLLLYYGDIRENGLPYRGPNCLGIQAVPGEEAPREIRFLHWGDGPLPVLFWEEMVLPGKPLIPFDDPSGPAAVCQEEGGPILMSADLVRTCFDLLSRREEQETDRRDAYGRFLSSDSLAHRRGFLRFPVVDAVAALLDSLLSRLFRAARIPCLRAARWPGGRPWALCLTHDVDWVKKWTLGGVANYLFRRAAFSGSGGLGWRRRLAAVLGDLRAGRDPYDNIEEILGLESEHGVDSTFFFLPGVPNQRRGGRKILGGYPGRFDLGRQAARIRQAGGEVELHGSFDSYDAPLQLTSEREGLRRQAGSDPRGIRQHFLRYRFPHTARCHQEAGLDYDSTLGFGDRPGYRCGTSFPYRLFDPSANGPMTIMEIPLVIMDGALEAVRGGTAKASRATMNELLDRTEAFGSICTLLWHNTSFAEIDDGGLLRDLYVRALRRARSSRAWTCSCGQLLAWWRWRSQIELTIVTGGSEEDRRWRLRMPSGDQGPLVLECLMPGDRRLQIEGGRVRMLPGIAGGEQDWIRMEVFDRSRQELSVRSIPR